MLTNSRFRNRCILSRFILTFKKIFLRFNLIFNKFWNVLLHSFFQSLGLFTYVHTITVAQVFVYKIFSLMSRQNILLKTRLASFLKRKFFELSSLHLATLEATFIEPLGTLSLSPKVFVY